MQQVGTVALPPAPVGVALPVGVDGNQEAVQAMRPGSLKEATKARSRGHTPVEADGAAGMDRTESREDGRRRCAAGGEDREAVLRLRTGPRIGGVIPAGRLAATGNDCRSSSPSPTHPRRCNPRHTLRHSAWPQPLESPSRVSWTDYRAAVPGVPAPAVRAIHPHCTLSRESE